VTSRCHEVLVHSLDLYMHFGALDRYSTPLSHKLGSVSHFLGRGFGTLITIKSLSFYLKVTEIIRKLRWSDGE